MEPSPQIPTKDDARPKMTLALAWVRKVAHTTELVLAADSRLRSIGHWDACPKILPLGRSDAALCFAGDTMHAYPLMLQARAAVEMFPRARNRGLDLHDLRGHLVRVMNGMRSPDLLGLAEPVPESAFLLGGWSWKLSRFRLWTIYFDPRIGRFSARRASRWQKSGPKWIHFVGDDLFVTQVERARARLLRLCRRKAGLPDVAYHGLPLLRGSMRAAS